MEENRLTAAVRALRCRGHSDADARQMAEAVPAELLSRINCKRPKEAEQAIREELANQKAAAEDVLVDEPQLNIYDESPPEGASEGDDT